MLAFTPEQGRLFAALCEWVPGARIEDWESIGVDRINDKEVLCLRMRGAPGADPVFLPFHPDGCTEEEAEALARRHGLTHVTWAVTERGTNVPEEAKETR